MSEVNLKKCYPLSSAMFLVINIVLHILILYSFLSAFFILYISKVEHSAFQSEFDGVIEDNLPTVLANADAKSGGKLKPLLTQMMPVLQILNNIYSEPSTEVVVYNQWLFRSMIMVIVILAITFSLLTGILKYACKTCLPVTHILTENIMLFAVIGVAEYLFFTKIASKFIPVPPSLLVNTLIDRIKNNLASQ